MGDEILDTSIDQMDEFLTDADAEDNEPIISIKKVEKEVDLDDDEGDEGEGDADPQVNPEMAELRKMVLDQSNVINGLKDRLLDGQKVDEPDPLLDDEPEPDDLDNLDTKELIEYTQRKTTRAVMNELKPLLEPLQNNIQDLTQKQTVTALKSEIDSVRAKDPGLDYWKQEIIGITKDTPGLSVKRALALAKLEDPQKDRKIRQRIAKKTATKRPYTGIGTGASTRASSGSTGNMNAEDSFNAAWGSVQALLDSEL